MGRKTSTDVIQANNCELLQKQLAESRYATWQFRFQENSAASVRFR